MSFTDKFGTPESTFGNIGFALGTTYNGNLYDRSVNHTLSLTQAVTIGRVLNVNQSLSLVHDVDVEIVNNTSGEHTLTLTQSVDVSITYERSITSTLTLSSVESDENDFERTLDSTLTLVQALRLSRPLVADSTLVLSQDTDVAVVKLATNALTLSQDVDLFIGYAKHVTNTLILSQEVDFTRNVGGVSQSVSGLSHSVGHSLVKTRNVESILSMAVEVVRDRTNDTRTSSLALVQTAGQQRIITRSVQHTLVLESEVARETTLNLGVSNALTFKSQHSRRTGIASMPVVTIPSAYYVRVASVRQNVDSSCDPYRGTLCILEIPGLSVILPTAEFDDTQSYNGRVSIKRSMNGQRRIYHRKMGIAQKLTYDFIIDRRKAIELRSFLLQANSIPVKLTNWKGEVWQVLITNNPLTFTEEKYWGPQPGGNKSSITLEFEGARIN